MSDILETILARKREEIAALRERVTETMLRAQAEVASAPRGFSASLRRHAGSGGAAVIAEIKRASPSKGLIRADFDPAWLARDYERGGAACLSILTDRDFFQGADEYLVAARSAGSLPVIRKDFMVDPLQIIEARALAADCVLLIAGALSETQLVALDHLAHSLGMDVLVEVHDSEELAMVVRSGVLPRSLLGINNRNLRSFETRLETTLELLELLPPGCEVVTESGIGSRADVQRMLDAGVRRFLIGESLMRQPSPGDALRDVLL